MDKLDAMAAPANGVVIGSAGAPGQRRHELQAIRMSLLNSDVKGLLKPLFQN